MKPDFSKVDAFYLDKPLILEPAPNGGWVLRQYGRPGEDTTMLGAYSNKHDMLDALNEALSEPDA